MRRHILIALDHNHRSGQRHLYETFHIFSPSHTHHTPTHINHKQLATTLALPWQLPTGHVSICPSSPGGMAPIQDMALDQESHKCTDGRIGTQSWQGCGSETRVTAPGAKAPLCKT